MNADGSSCDLFSPPSHWSCGRLLFPSRVMSVLSAPLFFQVRNGHIKRITDNDIQSLVLEIEGTNVR